MTKKIPDINDINPTKASKEFADKEAESFSEAALEKKAKKMIIKRKRMSENYLSSRKYRNKFFVCTEQ